MNFNLPIVNVEPIATSPDPSTVASASPAVQSTASDSMVMGVPETHRSPHQIYVYAESITPAGNTDSESGVCAFDVVFCVCVTEQNCTKTYKVIRRIAVDKVKLACEAECIPPISVVEDKEIERKNAAIAQAKRMRQIAGLE
jgi:hypothetical protein